MVRRSADVVLAQENAMKNLNAGEAASGSTAKVDAATVNAALVELGRQQTDAKRQRIAA